MLTPEKLEVRTLGPRAVRSPLRLSPTHGGGSGAFISDEARSRYLVELPSGQPTGQELLFEKAGPREDIYFDPSQVRAAVVTCGGLCPGLNNVIRSVYLQLHHHYGASDVIGIQYGYHGFRPDAPNPPIRLTSEFVEGIHQRGGTVLGTSRGPVPADMVVNYLQREHINILFCVGGDGTQRGAHLIAEEALRRNARIAVVGIPKTIDNDIDYVWRSFGYFTAVARAKEVIDCAHVEAKGSPNGISLVKLMGRDAGFIAAGATLASQEVNFTLIPEVPFELDGEGGFLTVLRERMLRRRHAVIVVAEGAGQHLMPRDKVECDASGNVKHQDIGVFLRERIGGYFAGQNIPINLRYFDPSYYIRSVPANTEDALLCDQLARYAVHAAMAGKTDLLIGLWYNVFLHVPIPLATEEKKRIHPDSEVWTQVLAATGQPARFG